jgi:ankyrin repeat protein
MDIDHNTPVHWAAVKGHLNVLQFLLDKGFPTSSKNKDGDTPL